MNLKGKTFKVIQLILAIWGGISLIGIIVIVSYVAYSLTIGNTTVEGKATKSDVGFVLNWCKLGDERIDKVINSHKSARSFSGDHHDAYAIKITNVTVNELLNISDNQSEQWYRMDSLPAVVNDAVSFIDDFRYQIPWFPTDDSLRMKDVYVYPYSIHCYGISPESVQLIFIKPKEKMVYYVSAEN